MLRKAHRQTPRKSRRRWHLAPVITHGPETLEGGAVLDEVEGTLGLLLWTVLRDVRLWAEAPPEEHGLLFAGGAAGRLRSWLTHAADAPELRKPLQALIARTADFRAVSDPDAALACERVAGWALARGHGATALEFTQAAALADPTHPPTALRVAQMAGRQGQDARAETWLRRAVSVARRAEDWDTYAGAILQLGRLYGERGNARIARRFLVRALRAAIRYGRHETRLQAVRALARR